MKDNKAKSAKELAYNPEPKPEDKAEQWRVYNEMWASQARGKKMKLYAEWAGAPLKAAIVGDPYADYMPNGDDAEAQALLKDNASDEIKSLWSTMGGKRIRDADPEFFDQIVEAIDARDKAYEKEGVTVFRNTLGWYPDELVNYNASWDGAKFISIYAGGIGNPTGNHLVTLPDTAAVLPWMQAPRALFFEIMKNDPDARPLPWYEKEPDPTYPGPGIANVDCADYRVFPNKHIVWVYGVADKNHINDSWDMDPHLTPSGTPMGRELLMRNFSDLGYTHETVWLDSRITYHHDCLMMNIKEGICGLPDDGKNGYWSNPPKAIKDWEIIPLPMDEVKKGVSNSVTLGNGKVFIDSTCTKTMDLLDKHGIEPVPIPYQNIWS